MTVKDYKQFLEISKVLNKTFGVPSPMKSSTESVMINIVDDTFLSGTFITTVTYTSDSMWRELRKRYIEEGLVKITKVLDDAAEEYKKNNDGKTITFKIMQNTIGDGLENLSYSMWTPVKKAYFRLHCNIEVS